VPGNSKVHPGVTVLAPQHLMRKFHENSGSFRQHSRRMGAPNPPMLDYESPVMPQQWTVKDVVESHSAKQSRRSDYLHLAAIFLGTLLVIASLLVVFPQNKVWQLQSGPRRPARTQYAEMARWLMAKNNWGIMR
jgi:hypothetical protein